MWKRWQQVAVGVPGAALIIAGFWAPISEGIRLPMLFVGAVLQLWQGLSGLKIREAAKQPPAPIG